MGNREYNTKQKELILQYLNAIHGRHVTVDDVYEHLHSGGYSIGKTTVYRYLERLVQQGVARKYSIDNDRGACYQYVGVNTECSEHFHLKCTCCGRLIHVHCKLLNRISEHVQETHGFTIDNSKTVFYGLCDRCREMERT